MTKRRTTALAGDWTVNKRTGRSNSSPEYNRLCKEVESLIRGGAHSLIAGNAGSVAGLIMAQLAHVHGLAPVRVSFGESTPPAKED